MSLFEIRNEVGEIVDTGGFNDKKKAKEKRNELRKEYPGSQFYITKGDDHWRKPT